MVCCLATEEAWHGLVAVLVLALGAGLLLAALLRCCCSALCATPPPSHLMDTGDPAPCLDTGGPPPQAEVPVSPRDGGGLASPEVIACCSLCCEDARKTRVKRVSNIEAKIISKNVRSQNE